MITHRATPAMRRSVAALTLAIAGTINAQDTTSLGQKRTVVAYMHGFSITPGDSTMHDIATYARLSVSFALSRLPRISLRGEVAPVCRVSQLGDSALRPETSQSIGVIRDDQILQPSGFFSIRGLIEPTSTDTAFLVDIEATQCTRHGPENVFHRTATVSRAAAANELSVIAEELLDRVQFNSKLGLLVTLKQDTALRAALNSFLLGSASVRPVDSVPDLRLKVTIDSGHVAHMELVGLATPLDWTVPLPADIRTPSRIAERLATEVSHAVDASLYGLRVSANNGAVQRQSAVGSARLALCIAQDSSCHVAPEAALAALRSIQLSQASDPEVLILEGRTQLALGDNGSALKALSSADSIIRVRPSAVPNEVSAAVVHKLMGDAYRGAGNYSDASREYYIVIRTNPGDTAAVLALVETLRSSGRHLEALNLTRQWAAAFPDNSNLYSAAESVVQDMDVRVLVDSVAKVREICRSAKQLQASCASQFAKRGVELGRSGGSRHDAHLLLDSAFALGLSDSSLVVSAALTLASQIAEGVQFPLVAGSIQTAPAYNRQSLLAYLDLAQRSMSDNTPPASREWYLRIRAISAAADRDLPRAYNGAVEAARTLPTKGAAQLAAHVALASALAPQPTLGPPGNGSRDAWFHEARQILDSSIAKYKDDRAMPRLLLIICENLMSDFPCAFHVAETMIERGLTGVRPTLEAVETSVLVGRYSVGRSWMTRINKDSLRGCDRSLAELFEVWGSLQENDTATAHRAFDNWKTALGGMSSAERSRVCWDFSGAEKVLQGPKRPPWAGLVLEMVRSMKDRRAIPPVWHRVSRNTVASALRARRSSTTSRSYVRNSPRHGEDS